MLTEWQSALDYLYGLTNWETRPPGTLPTFELDRIRALLVDLGDPQRRWPAVHVGGTNGKGSTCAMIAAGLEAAGYRVGLYTSPHMHTVRERIRVDGAPIDEAAVLAWLNTHRPLLDRHAGLTTFEALTALAFDHFARAQVGVAVIEVGLGGRLDTTNVVEPAVTVLTPIDLDHTQVLGDTVAQIAADKVGIFKPGVPVVSAPQADAADAVIAAEAARLGVPVTRVGRDVAWTTRSSTPWRQGLVVETAGTGDGSGAAGDGRPNTTYLVDIHLAGPHQRVNAATAVAALDVLARSGWSSITPRTVAVGLAAARWPGRFECFGNDPDADPDAETNGASTTGGAPGPGRAGAAAPSTPTLVIDGAHNPHAARALLAALDACFPGAPLRFILGFSTDKDAGAILDRWLPAAERVVAARSSHVRAMPAERVAELVATRGRVAATAATCDEALDLAFADAGPGTVIVATGSIFLAADVRMAWFRRNGLPLPPHDPPFAG